MVADSEAPRVTVIIPVYNGEAFLRETVESVLSQTVKEIEVLIVNDGSTDRSIDVIGSFNDARIRVINKTNEGLCATLNLAIDEAGSEIVARIDQDDLSVEDRLERQLAMVAEHGLDCLFTDTVKFGAVRGWSNKDKLSSKKGFSFFNPEEDGCLLHSTMMAKKRVLLAYGYRSEYYPADDWDLSLRLSESCKVGYLHEPLIKYRIHSSANTYKYFNRMQFCMRWANDSHKRRVSGLPELSMDEYYAEYVSNPLRRMNRSRKDFSKLCYRRAGDYYLLGRVLPMMACCFFSFCAAPCSNLKKLKNLLS
jgi:glycosyltransferase involved in cell wall biosynthesis